MANTKLKESGGNTGKMFPYATSIMSLGLTFSSISSAQETFS